MLTAEAVQKIKADHESLRLRVRELEGKAARAQSQVTVENVIYVKVTEQVDPASGVTLGAGKADVLEFDRKSKSYSEQTRRANYGGELSNREIEVYNRELVPIPIDTVVRCFRDFKSGVWIVEAPQTAIGYTTGGISARTGTTAGTGSIDVFYRTQAGVLTDTGENLAVYNIADAAVGSSSYVMVKRSAMSGYWYVDFAEC